MIEFERFEHSTMQKCKKKNDMFLCDFRIKTNGIEFE
jgi:hypothetical protein